MPLLGNVCASSILEVDLYITENVGSIQLVYCTIRFCIGISPRSRRKGSIYGHPNRVWHEQGKHKVLCVEYPLQYLWTETGWKGLKPTPRFQNRQRTKFCTVQTRQIWVTSRNDYICTLYRWLIDHIIKDMQEEILGITIDGNLQDFFGVNIMIKSGSTIHLIQIHLIYQIIKDLRLEDQNVTTNTIPWSSSKFLLRHNEAEAFDRSFDYQSVIERCNYLENSARRNTVNINHQFARLYTDPKQEHGNDLQWLGSYLKKTQDKSTILRPCGTKYMEVYFNSGFSENWDGLDSHNRDTARSRHSYIIMYAGKPFSCKYHPQTEIAISWTESE